MNLRPVRCILVVALALCCSREHKVGTTQSSANGAPKILTTPAPKAPAFDPAAARVLVDRWVATQNALDFPGYSVLYADDFTGIKRVGDKVTSFDRTDWLNDRKTMFARDMRVEIFHLQVFKNQELLTATFTQQWTSSTFSDKGEKMLTLRLQAGRLLIVREEMLKSRINALEPTGRCSQLAEHLQEPAPDVQNYADLGSIYDKAPSKWVKVPSHADANKHAVDEYAWSFAAVTSQDGWTGVFMFHTSPSGDWSKATNYCFRPDGTLAQLVDQLGTFYSLSGFVSDTTTQTFSETGKGLSSKTEAYYPSGEGKPAPGSYMRPPPEVIPSLSKLPFQLGN